MTEDNLADYVTGLVLTNDVSARDVQMQKAQFYESKSYPTFTPVGPTLVLLEPGELKRFGELRLQLRVNGELRQQGCIRDLILGPVEIVSRLSAFVRLEPGDLIACGTFAGIGWAAGRMLQPGDRIRVEIDGIGGIDNLVVPKGEANP